MTLTSRRSPSGSDAERSSSRRSIDTRPSTRPQRFWRQPLYSGSPLVPSSTDRRSPSSNSSSPAASSYQALRGGSSNPAFPIGSRVRRRGRSKPLRISVSTTDGSTGLLGGVAPAAPEPTRSEGSKATAGGFLLPGFVSSTAPPGGPVQSPPLLLQLWVPTSSRSNH